MSPTLEGTRRRGLAWLTALLSIAAPPAWAANAHGVVPGPGGVPLVVDNAA